MEVEYRRWINCVRFNPHPAIYGLQYRPLPPPPVTATIQNLVIFGKASKVICSIVPPRNFIHTRPTFASVGKVWCVERPPYELSLNARVPYEWGKVHTKRRVFGW